MQRILILLALFACAGRGATIFTMVPSAGPYVVGQPFAVGVQVADVAGMVAYQFDIPFSTNLEAQSITAAGLFGSDGVGIFYFIDNSAGLITLLSDALVGAAVLNGSDTLVTITFLPLAAGTFTVDFDNAAAYDESFNLIAAGYTGLSATSEPPAAAPEPTTGLLGGLGLCALGLWRKTRKTKSART